VAVRVVGAHQPEGRCCVKTDLQLTQKTSFTVKMPDFTTTFHSLLGNIIELSAILIESTLPPPPSQPGRALDTAIASTQMVSVDLIHKIGMHAGLSMDEYVGRVHTWEGTNFLTFKARDNFRGKSIYTLNLKTRRPTQTSPIQKHLNAELELALVLA